MIRGHPAHTDIERALRQFELRHAVVDIKQRHTGAAAHPRGGEADLQFGTRAGGDPKAVAGDQRPIDDTAHPFVFTGGRKTHRAADVSETRHPRRRIGERNRRPAKRGESQEQRGKSISKTSFLVHGDSCGSLVGVDVDDLKRRACVRRPMHGDDSDGCRMTLTREPVRSKDCAQSGARSVRRRTLILAAAVGSTSGTRGALTQARIRAVTRSKSRRGVGVWRQ